MGFLYCRRKFAEELEPYVRELGIRMAEGFLEGGLPVCGGSPGPHLGNIVALGA